MEDDAGWPTFGGVEREHPIGMHWHRRHAIEGRDLGGPCLPGEDPTEAQRGGRRTRHLEESLSALRPEFQQAGQKGIQRAPSQARRRQCHARLRSRVA